MTYKTYWTGNILIKLWTKKYYEFVKDGGIEIHLSRINYDQYYILFDQHYIKK